MSALSRRELKFSVVVAAALILAVLGVGLLAGQLLRGDGVEVASVASPRLGTVEVAATPTASPLQADLLSPGGRRPSSASAPSASASPDAPAATTDSAPSSTPVPSSTTPREPRRRRSSSTPRSGTRTGRPDASIPGGASPTPRPQDMTAAPDESLPPEITLEGPDAPVAARRKLGIRVTALKASNVELFARLEVRNAAASAASVPDNVELRLRPEAAVQAAMRQLGQQPGGLDLKVSVDLTGDSTSDAGAQTRVRLKLKLDKTDAPSQVATARDAGPGDALSNVVELVVPVQMTRGDDDPAPGEDKPAAPDTVTVAQLELPLTADASAPTADAAVLGLDAPEGASPTEGAPSGGSPVAVTVGVTVTPSEAAAPEGPAEVPAEAEPTPAVTPPTVEAEVGGPEAGAPTIAPSPAPEPATGEDDASTVVVGSGP